MASVLVIDDDETIASVVVGYLTRAGHAARSIGDGLDALHALETTDVDLVVLDIMLPGMDGLELCRHVRKRSPELPVVMLTALGEVDDRIAGLEVGADDYLTKPFSPRELVLRIESVLRRSARGTATTPAMLTAGSVELEPAARRAFRGGVPLSLTTREFDLLAFLLARPGVAFSRTELMRQVWGWSFGDESTVTVHVRRLREKVEDDPTAPQLINTVWGVGYRLDPP